MDSYSTAKGLHFSFLKKFLGPKKILTPRGMIPRGVSFLEPKSQITQRNLNQNQWPWQIRIMKKTGGRKSRWTVPLSTYCILYIY